MYQNVIDTSVLLRGFENVFNVSKKVLDKYYNILYPYPIFLNCVVML